MNLLPRHQSEFSTQEYWNIFFTSNGSKSFEWYGNYSNFCTYIAKYIKTLEKILVIGCGNSELSSSMYDEGYKHIMNIDNNASIIQTMTEKFRFSKPDLIFSEMEITNLKIKSNEYSVVLDKGTLDAIFSEDTVECKLSVEKMFTEIDRVLKFGGRYFCITLAQPFIAQYTLKFFFNLGWMIRVCRVSNNIDYNSFYLPVFIFVLTKCSKIPENNRIIEISYFEDKIERLSNINDLLKSIDELQKYAIIKNQLKRGHVFSKQICFEIYDILSNLPRYKIILIDGKFKSKKIFAIFIVPQGRELEWMYCTDEGRQILYDHCGYQRLLIVILNRPHTFIDLNHVKEELSSIVLELAPPKNNKLIPFLTIGDSICATNLVHKGKTNISGEFIIEDVHVDGNILRRLIFLSNLNLIQSEVKLIQVNDKMPYICSNLHLSSVYHLAFVSAIVFCTNFPHINSKLNLLLVGLGAGNFAMFLKEMFELIFIDCIEIDEEIIKIAQNYFGFKCDKNITCYCGDGIKLIKEMSEKKKQYDIIYIDVDNKNISQGLSCPPEEFLDSNFLENCIKLTKISGLLVFNVACRNIDLHEMVISKLKLFFPIILSQKFEFEINEVVYCIHYKNKSSNINLTHDEQFEKYKNGLKERWIVLISKLKNKGINYEQFSSFNFNSLKLL